MESTHVGTGHALRCLAQAWQEETAVKNLSCWYRILVVEVLEEVEE
ncbi:MAG: hypothetical protein KKC18_01050 [Chloroflexi bacterium]|nr:hypothetical protein [Chloroflexota bacterium]